VSGAHGAGGTASNCSRLVNQVSGRSLRQIFYIPDNAKFYSSMTLFARALEGASGFREALLNYCGGAGGSGDGGEVARQTLTVTRISRGANAHRGRTRQRIRSPNGLLGQ
jgi:hypothetical protein